MAIVNFFFAVSWASYCMNPNVVADELSSVAKKQLLTFSFHFCLPETNHKLKAFSYKLHIDYLT